jgi:hypothetical protein
VALFSNPCSQDDQSTRKIDQVSSKKISVVRKFFTFTARKTGHLDHSSPPSFCSSARLSIDKRRGLRPSLLTAAASKDEPALGNIVGFQGGDVPFCPGREEDRPAPSRIIMGPSSLGWILRSMPRMVSLMHDPMHRQICNNTEEAQHRGAIRLFAQWGTLFVHFYALPDPQDRWNTM